MRFVKLDRVIAAFSLAVLIFGATFGLLAGSAGLSPAQAIVMSALVFAGAAQFAVISALEASSGAWIALIAGALLNLRLLALGLAVSSGLSGRRPIRALQSYFVTDESVAVAARPDGSVDGERFLRAGLWVASGWVVGTAVGAFAGSAVEDPLVWGLDAAFPAGFLALIAPRLRADNVARKVALLGAFVGLALAPLVALGVAPLVASLAAVVAVKK